MYGSVNIVAQVLQKKSAQVLSVQISIHENDNVYNKRSNRMPQMALSASIMKSEVLSNTETIKS